MISSAGRAGVHRLWGRELTRLKVDSYKPSGGQRFLQVPSKGGKERRVPLHQEAFEPIDV
jgi:hypothetical protein